MKGRETRVSPGVLHSVSFRIGPVDGGIYARGVSNLSTGGIGLLIPTEPELRAAFEAAAKGHPLEGELAIGGRAFPVRLEVVHSSEELIGTRFAGNERDGDVAKAILEYFDIELAGLAVARQEAPGGTLRFAGRNHCELEVDESAGKLRGFRGKLFGNPFEGAPGTGLKTAASGAESPELHENLHRFLKSVPGLPAPLLKQILAVIDTRG